MKLNKCGKFLIVGELEEVYGIYCICFEIFGWIGNFKNKNTQGKVKYFLMLNMILKCFLLMPFNSMI